MKRTYHSYFACCRLAVHTCIIFVAVCGIAATVVACSDDDLTGYVPDGQSITIVRNNLLFPAQGSTATVEVRASGSLSAQTDASWAHATVDGNIVSVTVETNTHYEGRTALLTLQCGEDSRQLPIQQRGVIVGTLPTKDRCAGMGGERFEYTVAHDLPMTVESPQDWIHPTMEGEELVITVDASTDGRLRRGLVVSECNQLRDTLSIVQYDVQQHVVGTYYMFGYSGGDTGLPVATRFDVVEQQGNFFMNWPTQDLWRDTFIPLTFDAASCTLFFPSMMFLYEKGSDYDYAVFYDTEGVVATSDRLGANARMNYYETDNTTYAVLTAANWPGHELGGFVIRSSRVGGLVVTNLLQLSSPVIMRIGPVGTE